MIDWDAAEILINPRHPEREQIKAQLEGVLQDHFWFLTSGSTGEAKGVALSKNALFASAHAVNQHLEATARDTWLNVLPHFHVGGAGILARAHLSGSKVVTLSGKWNPAHFLEEAHQATLTSLVPTQLYDLVMKGYEAPPSVRAVVLGGGALSLELYNKGKKLKWPLMPSYGLTECASQAATARLGSPDLKLLSHIEAKLNSEGFLMIKSPALLTAYAYFRKGKAIVEDPKRDGWFTTEDRASIGKALEIQGRNCDFVKIGGESVDMRKLSDLIDELKGPIDCALFAMPDERLGNSVHLAHTEKLIDPLLEKYHQRVLPFERIRETHLVGEIPRSPLGKLLKGELIEMVRGAFVQK